MASATRLAVADKPVEPQFVSLGEAPNAVDTCAQSIARRAFEIFQERGRSHGSDLDDWLRAESELFHPAHVAVAETDDALAVRAEVPGFHAEELDVSIEPHRLTITGMRRAVSAKSIRKIVYCDSCADRIFRALGLPVEVDPNKATAVLKDGILELTMPKAAFSPKELAPATTFAIVRAEDLKLWTDPFVEFLEGRL
jgi:HSP20 family protein